MRELRYCEICGLLIAPPDGEKADAAAYICEKCLVSRKVILTTIEAEAGTPGVKFRCPRCGALLQAKRIPSRARMRCPKCEAEFYAHPDGAVEPVEEEKEIPETLTITRDEYWAPKKGDRKASAPVPKVKVQVERYFDEEQGPVAQVVAKSVTKEPFFDPVGETTEVAPPAKEEYFEEIEKGEHEELAPGAEHVDVMTAIEHVSTTDEKAIMSSKQRKKLERLEAAKARAKTEEAERRKTEEPRGAGTPAGLADRRRPMEVVEEKGSGRAYVLFFLLALAPLLGVGVTLLGDQSRLAVSLGGLAARGIRGVDDLLLDVIPDEGEE